MISSKTGAHITLNAQYIKDFSFENPKAPSIYTEKISPDITVSVDVQATKLQENTYEVELIINATAKHKDEPVFIIELKHGGIFHITNIEESLIEESVFVDCPYLLYPYARKIISLSTMDANFPPLNLDLIDFDALYKDQKHTDFK